MNLLVISIDSLRLDHAPRISATVSAPRFVAQTHGFQAYACCFSVASATRPVHASVFSGVYPFEHGVTGQRSPAVNPVTPDLMMALRTQGWQVHGYSEARTVFTGLPVAGFLQDLDARPQAGLEQLARHVHVPAADRTALFVHYWSTHTPYGATDGRALGEVGQLLAAGRVDQVRERYQAAVVELFEQKLAPLLEALDRNRWIIVVFSDHGESWTTAEPYHGQTLRNTVIRVPLYMHMPGTHMAAADSLVSLVDIAPTLADRLDLDMESPLSGVSLLRPLPARCCLAQIDPVPGPDLPGVSDPSAYVSSSANSLWSVFNLARKLTGESDSDRLVLEDTLSEHPLQEPGTQQHLLACYREMVAASPYRRIRTSAPQTDEDLLDQRLRDLGYLA